MSKLLLSADEFRILTREAYVKWARYKERKTKALFWEVEGMKYYSV